jgi:hypothetical protein
VTLLTPPEKKETLVGFYERCRPPGRWKGIREAARPAADGREAPQTSKLLGDAAVGIGACLGLVVATNALFAGAWTLVSAAGAIAVLLSAALIKRVL